MRRLGRIGAVLLVLGLAAVAGWTLWGPQPAGTWQLTPGGTAWQIPFGHGPHDVARAVGIDGRVYGPLTFAVANRRLVVADTYNARVICDAKRWRIIPAPGLMVEDMAVTPSNRILVADNRRVAVWGLGVRRTLIVGLDHYPGYTQAIWHIGWNKADRLLVEFVRFGHGTFEVHLNEYTAQGRLIRPLAVSSGPRPMRGPAPEGAGVIDSGPIRAFQVAPDGNVYIEPASVSPVRRTVLVYRENGQYVGQLSVTAPVGIRSSYLLGVDRRGWVYWGLNLTVPHQAMIVVSGAEGHTIASVPVAAVPVFSAVYGRVGPGGTVYLDQSTKQAYRIAVWHMTYHQPARWWHGW